MIVDLIKIMDRGYDAKPAQDWPIIGTGEPLDRTKYVTASEIGTCARMVKFNKETMILAGYKPELGTKNKSSDGWGFFERGHTMEAWAVDMIHDGWDGEGKQTRDFDLLHTGKNQVSFVCDEQSGTPDGVILAKDRLRVGIKEIKSIDPRTNRKNIPKIAHIKQVTQNLDLAAEYYGAVPIGGEIIYIDASDYKKRFQFHVPWDEEEAVALQGRAKWIMAAETPADLPAEGVFSGGCTYCAFTGPCSALLMKEKLEKGSVNDLDRASGKLFK